MIFPSYLTSHDVIGITAPSAGIAPEYQVGIERIAFSPKRF